MATELDFKDKISDFDAGFNRHPVTDDLVIKKELQSIYQHLNLLLIPGKYASLFRPSLTAGMSEYLFEIESPAIQEALKYRVKQIISEREPRVEVLDIAVTFDDYDLEVTVKFRVYSTKNIETYSSRMKRVR